MKKLRLDTDALVVQTFETVAKAGKGNGTVRGHDATTFCFTEQGTTCEPAYSCPECAYTAHSDCPESETC